MPEPVALDPIGSSADPRLYVPIESAERALAALAANVGAGISPALLLATAGAGKTLLLRVFAERTRRAGHRVAFSPFLHLPPDDVERWVAHLLDDSQHADAAAGGGVVLLIDEIQSAPEASVACLADLALRAGANLVVVAAGTPGTELEGKLHVLRPASKVTLPDRLPGAEMQALCDALLRHPELERALGRVGAEERERLVRSAEGSPAELRAELERRAFDGAGSSVAMPDSEAGEPAIALEAELRETETSAPCEAPTGLGIELLDLERWPVPAPTSRRRVALLAGSLRSHVTQARGRLQTRGSGAWNALHAIVTTRVKPAAGEARRAARSRLAVLRAHVQLLSATAWRSIAETSREATRWPAFAVEWRPSLRAGLTALVVTGISLGIGSAAHRGPIELAAAPVPLASAVLPVRSPDARSDRPPHAVERPAPPPAPAAPAPTPVRVQVNARPWAQVRVNGVDAGETPLSNLLLLPGSYDFEARFADGRVVTRRVEIGSEQRFVSLP